MYNEIIIKIRSILTIVGVSFSICLLLYNRQLHQSQPSTSHFCFPSSFSLEANFMKVAGIAFHISENTPRNSNMKSFIKTSIVGDSHGAGENVEIGQSPLITMIAFVRRQLENFPSIIIVFMSY